jgi:hypothetical protein
MPESRAVDEDRETGDEHPVFVTADLEEEPAPKAVPARSPAENLGEKDRFNREKRRDFFNEEPAEPVLSSEPLEIAKEPEFRMETADEFPPLPTMGIPETVGSIPTPLPFEVPVPEIEIEKEVEIIAPSGKPVAREVEPAGEEAADLWSVPETREKIMEAAPSEGFREEKPPVRAPVVRLGFFRRIRATIFDLLVVGIFWTGAVALAAHFLSVPILDLIIAAAVPLGILFAVLLTVYLFMFLLFLGETPGGRLAMPKN